MRIAALAGFVMLATPAFSNSFDDSVKKIACRFHEVKTDGDVLTVSLQCGNPGDFEVYTRSSGDSGANWPTAEWRESRVGDDAECGLKKYVTANDPPRNYFWIMQRDPTNCTRVIETTGERK